jgi:acyl carrier protein
VFDVRKSIQASKSLEEGVSAISEGIRNKLSSLLATPADNIELTKSISSNGIDSLVATEFRTWLVKDLCADIPLLDITGTASVLTLSDKIAHVTTLANFSASDN